MGRRKIAPGTPCKYGHEYARRGPHGCRACHRAGKKAAAKARASIFGVSHWKKRSAYLVVAGAPWIAGAHVLLKKRSRGKARASRKELLALWQSQNGLCALTGMRLDGVPHLDHIVPMSRGGGHTVDNLQWVHPMANLAKRDFTVEQFREWLLTAADSLREKIAKEELIS